MQGNTRRGRMAAAVASLMLLAVAATPAHARSTQESIFESNALLLQSGPAVQERTLDELDALGVDTIRALVQWRHIAPAPLSRRRPSGFNGADHTDYPPGNWAMLDSLLRGARARGMRVIVTPTGPGPTWAGRCGIGAYYRQTCKPSPTEFGRFVQALGRRYSGRVSGVPRATRWSMWNEPNVRSWLAPQFAGRGKGRYPYAAYWYRLLATAGVDALRRTGHRNDLILIGETAPIGHTTTGRSTATAYFLRSMLCLDERGRPLSGSLRTKLRCTRFKRIYANGIATHPYGRGGSQAPTSRARRDEITMSSLSRLKSISSAARRRGRVPRTLPIWLTEHGFQTDPPDDRLGVSLSTQARWINQSEWMAYRDSWVRGIAQYLLVDDGDTGGFQTGLKFASGREKPSYRAYQLPVWVSRHGRRSVRVWGVLRAAAPNRREVVRVQFRAPGGRYRTIRTVTVRNLRNVLNVVTTYRRGWYRLRWEPSAGGRTLYSRSMAAAPR